MCLRTACDKFFAYENVMMTLNSHTNPSHRAVLEWEEKECARLETIVEKMDQATEDAGEQKLNVEDIERILQKTAQDEDGVAKIRLPDFLWNEGYSWKLQRLMIDVYGQILWRARQENQKLLATIMVNRNSVKAKEGISQSIVNGDHTVAGDWLHNFVCFSFGLNCCCLILGLTLQIVVLIMDTLNSKTAILRVLILDRGSKMPKQDKKTLKWDWSPDVVYAYQVREWVKYVLNPRSSNTYLMTS